MAGSWDRSVVSVNGQTDVSLKSTLQSGDLSSAVEMCMGTGNWTEALILASAASPELSTRVQKKYFEVCGSNSSSDLVRVIATRDWKSFVEHCSLKDWESVLTTLLTHVTDKDELESLVGALGERLENSGNIIDLTDAIVCYVCIQKTNKVIECRAKVRHFDDVELLWAVSKAVGILKKFPGARTCNETEFQSMICSSRVIRPAAIGYTNAFICPHPQPGNGQMPGNYFVPVAPNSSIPQWNGVGVASSSATLSYPLQAPQLAPALCRNEFVSQPRQPSSLGYPVSNGSHHLPTTSQLLYAHPNSSKDFGAAAQFVNRPSVAIRSAPFTNSNGVGKRYSGPPVFQCQPAPHQFKADPLDFQCGTPPPTQSPSHSTIKSSGFLSKLKSPACNSNHKQEHDLHGNKSGESSNEDDSPTSILGSTVSSDTLQQSSFEECISYPEHSLDSESFQESVGEGFLERNHNLCEFMERVKEAYCCEKYAMYPIRNDAVEMLADRIDYWQRKFQ